MLNAISRLALSAVMEKPGEASGAASGTTGDKPAGSGDGTASAGSTAGDGAAAGDQGADKASATAAAEKAVDSTAGDGTNKGTTAKGAEGAADAAGAKSAATDSDGKGDEGAAEDDEVPIWPEQGWPDNWRDRVIGSLGLEGDALKKAQERAKRATNPGELLRTVLSGDQKISELSEAAKGRIKIPGKDSKPDEVAAFQKAWGVPEKVDDYKLPDRPKDMGERTELDIELLKPAMEAMHKSHFSQAQIETVIKAMDAAEIQMSHYRANASQEFDKQAEDDLRVTYGTPKDYHASIEMANRVLQQHLGKYMPEQGEHQELLNLTFDNGRKLGSYPAFVKFIVDIARNGVEPLADDGEIVVGEDTGAAKDPQQRMNEIARLMHTGKSEDEAEYRRLQPEMQRLAGIVERNKARGKR